MMKMEVQNHPLNHSVLSIPYKKGRRILIPLKYGEFQRGFLLDEALRKISVTITDKD